MPGPQDPQATTEYTAVLLIVVKAAQQQAGEDAAIAADPQAGAGTFVPGVPLRQAGDASNTVVAYWARWNMKPTQRSAFAQHLGGPILAANQQPNLTRDSWMFDAVEGAWTPESVLAALGYDRLAPEPI